MYCNDGAGRRRRLCHQLVHQKGEKRSTLVFSNRLAGVREKNANRLLGESGKLALEEKAKNHPYTAEVLLKRYGNDADQRGRRQGKASQMTKITGEELTEG